MLVKKPPLHASRVTLARLAVQPKMLSEPFRNDQASRDCPARTPGLRDVTNIRDPHGRIEREGQCVADSLRELAAHLDAAPHDQLVYALPIAGAAVGELRKRLSPWLR